MTDGMTDYHSKRLWRQSRRKARGERKKRKNTRRTWADRHLFSSHAGVTVPLLCSSTLLSSPFRSLRPFPMLSRHSVFFFLSRRGGLQPPSSTNASARVPRSAGYIIIPVVPRECFLANGIVVLWDSGRCPHRSHAS